MFTGLVADIGRVRSAEEGPGGGRCLVVETRLGNELEPGDSVAVSGVCLTAATVSDDAFSADLVAETIRRSSLGTLAPGDRVNLELPLRVGDRFGGHFVQGHVDGIGEVESVDPGGAARVMRVTAGPELGRYLVEKGSVAVDGVSLTVASVDEEGFTVSLIPETLARTTLGQAVPGRPVNLEVDMLVKHLERLVRDGAEAPA